MQWHSASVDLIVLPPVGSGQAVHVVYEHSLPYLREMQAHSLLLSLPKIRNPNTLF